MLLCLLAGAVYAGALYVSDRLNEYFSRKLIILLAALRFVVVFSIAFFLLGPMLKSLNRVVIKPIIAVAVDNSESIAAVKSDSAWVAAVRSLPGALGDDFDVRFFTFGKQTNENSARLALNFSESATSLSAVYEEFYNRFSNQNLGAVVLASDGIFNHGYSPEFLASKLKAPTIVLALGDTIPKRDAFVGDVLFNSISYLGNKFPLHIELGSYLLRGQEAILTVRKGDKELFRQNVTYDSDAWNGKYTTYIDSDKAGIQRYDIQLTVAKDEATETNNRKSIFVEVLDSRQKILLLAANPHPDLAAIRSAAQSNENYQVVTHFIDDFDGKIADYSLVVFHGLPSVGAKGAAEILTAADRGIPQLYIIGAHTNFEALNGLKTGFVFRNAKPGTTQASAKFNDGFSLFITDAETQRLINKFPPLQAPFADIEVTNAYIALASQRIGNITTGIPLFALDNQSAVKRAFVGGDGLWRWRLFNYLENKSHAQFDQLMGKTIQFLAAKEDKSRFKIEVANRFEENEQVVFRARLFNDSFEPTNAPEATLKITDESGKAFDFVFTRTEDNGYMLNCGKLPEGNYTFVGATTFNAVGLKKSGTFSVSRVSNEMNRLIADHGLLYRLSQNTGGQLLPASQADQLADTIKQNADITSVAIEQKSLTDLINQWWILLLLLLLLGGEWLLRKWSGAY